MVDAANSISAEPSRDGGPLPGAAFNKLRDQLFLSPRLSQWQVGTDEKSNRGYWLKSQDQTITVTVREDKVILSASKCEVPWYPFYDVVTDGLAAATLFKSIQDAQAIVQPKNPSGMATDDEDGEFFGDNDPKYLWGANMDPALEETHPKPLVEDDAELIEEVCAEEEISGKIAADEETPALGDTHVWQKNEHGEQCLVEKQDSYTTAANQKNAVTDGFICPYCGNLNQSAYKGTCPKCPKTIFDTEVERAKVHESLTATQKAQWMPPQSSKGLVLNTAFISNLKSLQGRVLTIVDGSFSDKTQREAVKQMINKEFRREIGKVTGE
jgi:hypothetical protein